MLFYSQAAGLFTIDGVVTIQGCYSGNGVWKNHNASQNVRNSGPLPTGQYTLSPLHTIPHLGPSMALTPAPANTMFGRSGFFVHLDNPAHPGQSSDGCIVLANDSFMTGMAKLQALEKLRASGEDQLTVVDLIPGAQWPAPGAGGPITATVPTDAPVEETVADSATDPATDSTDTPENNPADNPA